MSDRSETPPIVFREALGTKMKNARMVSCLALVVFMVCSVVMAQEAGSFTNESILIMVKQGIPEDAIIGIIKNAPVPLRFDTCYTRLSELKAQGISDSIIEAMVIAQLARLGEDAQLGVLKREGMDSASEPPKELGAYYRADSGWIRLRKAPSPETKAKVGAGTFLFGATRAYMQFLGAHAETQLSDRRPTLYVKDYGWDDERTCTLIKLKVDEGDNYRGVHLSKRASTGVPKKYRVPIDAKKVSEFIVVTPVSDLEPGEYLLSPISSPVMGYEFGISVAQKGSNVR